MALLNEFSIQLFSVKDDIKNDFFGTLKRVAEIGFTGIEFAGYPNFPANDIKKALDEDKLRPVGVHYSMGEINTELDRIIETSKVLGTETVICAWAPVDTRDETLRLAEDCNKAGQKCADAGLRFAYHNHSYEFQKDNGEYLFDILYGNTCKKTVFAELDLFWIACSGLDPLEYIRKYADRARLLHLKQVRDVNAKISVDLPDGILDFQKIITESLSLGIPEFVLEQEAFEISPWVSVKKGFDHIMSL